jgi:hypothetical protein
LGSVGVGVVLEMVVLELVGEFWRLVASAAVAVVIVGSFVGSLVFFGREGRKYIAFDFESVSPLPMCISRPKHLHKWKIQLVPWMRSSLVAKGKKVSSTYRG